MPLCRGVVPRCRRRRFRQRWSRSKGREGVQRRCTSVDMKTSREGGGVWVTLSILVVAKRACCRAWVGRRHPCTWYDLCLYVFFPSILSPHILGVYLLDASAHGSCRAAFLSFSFFCSTPPAVLALVLWRGSTVKSIWVVHV